MSPYVKLNVYNYYGNNRTKDSAILSGQDVVLTTYNTLAAEFKAGKVNLDSSSLYVNLDISSGQNLVLKNLQHTIDRV